MTFTPRLGDHSWFAIARQTDNQTPITDITKFVQNRYPFTSLGLDLEGELQASESIAGRRSDTRDQQGQLWGSGTIETQLYIEKMDEFWRAIINSGKPTNTRIADTEVHTNTAFVKKIDTFTTQPTTPGQIEITLASTDDINHPLPADAALGTVDIIGQRRVGLETDALLPMKEDRSHLHQRKSQDDEAFRTGRQHCFQRARNYHNQRSNHNHYYHCQTRTDEICFQKQRRYFSRMDNAAGARQCPCGC